MPTKPIAYSTVNGAATGVRGFFRWLIHPVILVLWPRRHTWIVRNLANIISTIRLPVSVVVIVWWLYPAYLLRNLGSLYTGLLVMFLILMSDGIDGALARGLMTVSRYGKVVDPLADKVLYATMMGCLIAGGWQLLPRQAVAVMAIFVVIAIYYEVRLVLVAILADRECRLRNTAEPMGANMWGKTKFGVQAGAGFVGFALPWIMAGFSLSMGLAVLALPLAHMSLRGHQLDLEAIRLKPLSGVDQA